MEVGHEENQAHARTDSSQTQRSRSTAGGEHATGRSDAIAWCFTPDLSALAQPICRHETRRRGETQDSRERERTTQAPLGREGTGKRHDSVLAKGKW